MKRFILFLAVLGICGSAYSQKIVKNEKDDFTGRMITETSYTKFSDGFTCSLRKVDSTFILQVSFNSGETLYSMDENAEFMIKLQDGNIITLRNLEAVTGEYTHFNVGNVNISHFLLQTKYLISETNLKLLQANKIEKVRFYTTDGYIERDVSEKNAKKLLKLFNLI